MLLQTSLDVLYLALSGATVLLACFLAWVLYEIARLIRQGNAITAGFRENLAIVEDLVRDIADRVDRLAGYADTFLDIGDRLSGWVGRHHHDEDEEDDEFVEPVRRKPARRIGRSQRFVRPVDEE